jgi:DNA-binding XRE family transcriptional regulator
MSSTTTSYEQVKAKLLQDPEFRKAYDDLAPAYQIARLRIMRGLTQKELAEMVGTKQPSIARLESGKDTPTLGLLRRVAEALGAHLTVSVEPCEPVQHNSSDR